MQARWAKAVKDRDGWRCRIADCATPTDRIEAHHLRPLIAGGDYSLGNGITLCHGHHKEIHRGG